MEKTLTFKRKIIDFQDEIQKLLKDTIDIKKNTSILKFGFELFDQYGNKLFLSNHTDGNINRWPVIKNGINQLDAIFDISFLNDGEYYLEFSADLHCDRYLYKPGEGKVKVGFAITGLRNNSIYYTQRRSTILNPNIQWIAN